MYLCIIIIIIIIVVVVIIAVNNLSKVSLNNVPSTWLKCELKHSP